jgi:hypothetical protein
MINSFLAYQRKTEGSRLHSSLYVNNEDATPLSFFDVYHGTSSERFGANRPVDSNSYPKTNPEFEGEAMVSTLAQVFAAEMGTGRVPLLAAD